MENVGPPPGVVCQELGVLYSGLTELPPQLGCSLEQSSHRHHRPVPGPLHQPLLLLLHHGAADPRHPAQGRHLQPGPVAQQDDVLSVVVAGVGRVSEVLSSLHDGVQQGADLLAVAGADGAHPHHVHGVLEVFESPDDAGLVVRGDDSVLLVGDPGHLHQVYVLRLVRRDALPYHKVYQVDRSSHLTEHGVSVLSGGGRLRVSEAGLGGADQQDSRPVQHQPGALDLGSLSRSLRLIIPEFVN